MNKIFAPILLFVLLFSCNSKTSQKNEKEVISNDAKEVTSEKEKEVKEPEVKSPEIKKVTCKTSVGNEAALPIVLSGDPKLDLLINNDFLKDYLPEGQSGDDWEKRVSAIADEAYSKVYYEVTLNENNLLSFSVTTETCTAYCSEWTHYYSYDMKTGKRIKASEIMDVAKANEIVKKQVEKGYAKHLEKTLAEVEDDMTKDLIKEELDGCENSFKVEDFKLFKDEIEIVDHCSFRNVIKGFSPSLTLKFKFSELGVKLP